MLEAWDCVQRNSKSVQTEARLHGDVDNDPKILTISEPCSCYHIVIAPIARDLPLQDAGDAPRSREETRDVEAGPRMPLFPRTLQESHCRASTDVAIVGIVKRT